MSDDDERRARDTVEAAIEAYLRAQDHGGLLIEWCVLSVTHLADDDGTGTAIDLLPSDGLPLYRQVGILDFALTMARATVTAPDGGAP